MTKTEIYRLVSEIIMETNKPGSFSGRQVFII